MHLLHLQRDGSDFSVELTKLGLGGFALKRVGYLLLVHFLKEN